MHPVLYIDFTGEDLAKVLYEMSQWIASANPASPVIVIMDQRNSEWSWFRVYYLT